MTAQDLLSSIQQSNRQLNTMLRTQAALRDRARKSQPQKAQQCLKQARALAKDIESQFRDLDKRRASLCRLIDRLPAQEERDVLKLTYISGFTVDKAADILHFTPRHVYRLRSRGVQRLQALMNGHEKREINAKALDKRL